MLFMVVPHHGYNSNEYVRFMIVRAETRDQARELATEKAGKEGQWIYFDRCSVNNITADLQIPLAGNNEVVLVERGDNYV